MPEAVRVFLDTTVLKLAANRVIRGFHRERTVTWGDQPVTIGVTQFRTVPKTPRKGTEQAADAALLPYIAYLAARGRLELLWHLDGALELARLPNTDSPDGQFFGAPLNWVDAPVGYGRLIADGNKSMQEHQTDFLESLRYRRFLELQIAAGVKTGAKNRANQLLDAFHIWCAEHAKAAYFLTCDYKLVNHVKAHRRHPPMVSLVTPRALIAALRREHRIGHLDVLSFALHRLRAKLLPRPTNGLEDLAKLGESLESRGYFDPPQR